MGDWLKSCWRVLLMSCLLGCLGAWVLDAMRLLSTQVECMNLGTTCLYSKELIDFETRSVIRRYRKSHFSQPLSGACDELREEAGLYENRGK